MEYILSNIESVDKLVNQIVRPLRAKYSIQDLGPSRQNIGGIMT